MFFDSFAFAALILLLLFVIFPIYVVSRLAALNRDLKSLQDQVWGRLVQLSKDIHELKGQAPGPAEQTPAPVPAPPPPLLRVYPQQAPMRPSVPSRPRRVGRAPTPQPVQAAAAATAVAPAKPQRDIESVIGANWLAKLGVAAIVIAVGFFLQYAFASGVVDERARVIGGLVVAAIMIGFGYGLMGRERYRTFAQVLASGGIAVYFLSIYAAYSFYHFVGFTTAFSAMAVGALAASLLAAVNNSQSVALISILGAFAAPVLIREQSSAPHIADLIRLYTYIAALNLWVVGLMWARNWISVAVTAFAATWVLFFAAGSIRGSGWVTEGFASLFLLFSVVTGFMAAGRKVRTKEKETELVQGEATAGIGLILAGCAAFTIASSAALSGMGMLGVPDLILATVLVALLLAALSVAIPTLPQYDREVRMAFGYLAAGVLALVILSAFGSAPATNPDQAPIAFGFTLLNYLLFFAVAMGLYRRDEGVGPAVALIVANAAIHVVMVQHVLERTSFHLIPLAIIWLPVAGLLSLLGMGLAAMLRRDRPEAPMALALSALVIPFAGSVAAIQTQRTWQHPLGAGLFAAEFILFSATWLAFRRITYKAPYRVDLLGAFAIAAAFFGLMTRHTATAEYGGLALPAILAFGMAAYHGAIGAVALNRKDDDNLHRLTYLGLALTFLTIAIPLQLKAGYITVAWAVEAAVLIWTGLAVAERKVRFYGYAMMMIAMGRALFLDLYRRPEVFHFLFNTRMMVGATVIAAAYVSGWLLWRKRAEISLEEQTLWIAPIGAANVFTLLFVSWDLWDYAGKTWPAGETSAQQLALSIFWTIYALIGVMVGVWQRIRPVRLFAIGLLYVSVVKVFLFDLSALKQPYRIVSFFTLGVILLLVSLLYTRFEERLGVGGPKEPVVPEEPTAPVHKLRKAS